MLTQQCGRYLFKTFRTLLADRNAPMSSENRTREYILKVRAAVGANAPEPLTVADPHSRVYSTSTTPKQRHKSSTPEISATLNSSSTHSVTVLLTSPLLLSRSEILRSDHGTTSSLTSSDARKSKLATFNPRAVRLRSAFNYPQYRSRPILPRLQLCSSYPSRRRAQVEASASQGHDNLFRTLRLLHYGHRSRRIPRIWLPLSKTSRTHSKPSTRTPFRIETSSRFSRRRVGSSRLPPQLCSRSIRWYVLA